MNKRDSQITPSLKKTLVAEGWRNQLGMLLILSIPFFVFLTPLGVKISILNSSRMKWLSESVFGSEMFLVVSICIFSFLLSLLLMIASHVVRLRRLAELEKLQGRVWNDYVEASRGEALTTRLLSQQDNFESENQCQTALFDSGNNQLIATEPFSRVRLMGAEKDKVNSPSWPNLSDWYFRTFVEIAGQLAVIPNIHVGMAKNIDSNGENDPEQDWDGKNLHLIARRYDSESPNEYRWCGRCQVSRIGTTLRLSFVNMLRCSRSTGNFRRETEAKLVAKKTYSAEVASIRPVAAFLLGSTLISFTFMLPALALPGIFLLVFGFLKNSRIYYVKHPPQFHGIPSLQTGWTREWDLTTYGWHDGQDCHIWVGDTVSAWARSNDQEFTNAIHNACSTILNRSGWNESRRINSSEMLGKDRDELECPIFLYQWL